MTASIHRIIPVSYTHLAVRCQFLIWFFQFAVRSGEVNFYDFFAGVGITGIFHLNTNGYGVCICGKSDDFLVKGCVRKSITEFVSRIYVKGIEVAVTYINIIVIIFIVFCSAVYDILAQCRTCLLYTSRCV